MLTSNSGSYENINIKIFIEIYEGTFVYNFKYGIRKAGNNNIIFFASIFKTII